MNTDNKIPDIRRVSDLSAPEKQMLLKSVEDLVWSYAGQEKGIIYWLHEMFLAYTESEYSDLDAREAAYRYRWLYGFLQEVFAIFDKKCNCNQSKIES